MFRTAAGVTAVTVVLVVGSLSAPADADGPIVFANASPISTTGDFPPGTASPYPSTITVSGVTDPVTSVSVTLSGYDIHWPKDTDIMLVGPTGTAVMLMSDVPQVEVTQPIDLSFAADGAAFPDVPGVTPLESGTYRPTDAAELPGTDGGEPPAPAPQSSTTDLAGFAGQDPNGTWSLYVFGDTDTTANGSIGGWSLTFNGTGGCAVPRPTVAGSAAERACVIESVVHYKFLAHDFPHRATDVRKPDIIAVEAGAKGQTRPQADLRDPVHWRGTLAVVAETTGRDDSTILTIAGLARVAIDDGTLEIHGPVLVHRSNLKGCADGEAGRLLIHDRPGDAADTVGIAYCGRVLAWKEPPSDAFRVKTTLVDVVDGRR